MAITQGMSRASMRGANVNYFLRNQFPREEGLTAEYSEFSGKITVALAGRDLQFPIEAFANSDAVASMMIKCAEDLIANRDARVRQAREIPNADRRRRFRTKQRSIAANRKH